jgi:hypothetical protein
MRVSIVGEPHLAPAILVILALFVGIGLLIAAQVRADMRRKLLGGWARSRGFVFSPFRDGGFSNRYSDFECFGKGHSRYADNITQGRIGTHKLCAFDYHYTTGSGKSETRHRCSGVIVTTNLPLKPLLIRHQNLFDRLASLVGLQPIEFESAEFNKEFHVTSPDRRWAFDVLPQSTMEFLLDSPKFILEFQLCQIVAYRESLFQPQDFDAAIEVIEGVLSRLPASLLQELQGSDR